MGVSSVRTTGLCQSELEAIRLTGFGTIKRNQSEVNVADVRVSVEEDGSLTCQLLRATTTVSFSTFRGELLKRAEESAKQYHSIETWDKWLEMQEKTGRRWRRSRANPHGRK